MNHDDQALVATVTFFRAMRREWMRRTGEPADKCPMPNWEDVRGIDRQSFLRCMKTAIVAGEPLNAVDHIEKVRAL